MLRPMTRQSKATTVSLEDEAINIEKSDIDKYGVESHIDPSCWQKHLALKDGEKPTVFVIGVVPPEDMIRIEDDCGVGTEKVRNEELRWRSFLAGVRDIENWDGDKPEYHEVDGVKYIKPTWLRATFIRGLRRTALEVGARVYVWNQLQEQEGKN